MTKKEIDERLRQRRFDQKQREGIGRNGLG